MNNINRIQTASLGQPVSGLLKKIKKQVSEQVADLKDRVEVGGAVKVKSACKKSVRVEVGGAVGVKPADNKPVSRAQALVIANSLHNLVAKPHKGKAAFLPYAEDEPVSFKGAVDLLEKGKEVVFKPQEWKAIGEGGNFSGLRYVGYYMKEKNTRAYKMSSLTEFKAFEREVENKTLLKEVAQELDKFNRKPVEGKLAYLPFAGAEQNARKINLAQAVSRLKDGKTVTFRPFKWTREVSNSAGELREGDFRLVPAGEKYPPASPSGYREFNRMAASIFDGNNLKGGAIDLLPREEPFGEPSVKEIIEKLHHDTIEKVHRPGDGLYDTVLVDEGKLCFIPYQQGKEGLEKISFSDLQIAVKQGSPVFLKPRMWTKAHYNDIWDVYNGRGGYNLVNFGSKESIESRAKKDEMGPELLSPTRITSGQDLKDFYRITQKTVSREHYYGDWTIERKRSLES